MLPPQAAARRGRRTFGPSDGFRVPGKSLSQALSESLSPSFKLAFSWAAPGRPGPGGRRRTLDFAGPKGSRFFFLSLCKIATLAMREQGGRKGCQRAAWRPRVTVHGWRRSHCSRAAMTSTILLYRCPLLPPRPPRLLARLHGRVLLCPALHPGAETKKRGRAASREYSRRRGHPRWGAWCGPTGAR